MTTPPDGRIVMTPPDETPVLTALIQELQELTKRKAAPPNPKAMSCCYEDCEEDPLVAFLDGAGTFCPYHALYWLLVPAGPTVVQRALEDAHPLWQVQVIAVPAEPGTQVPPDPRAEPEQDWIFTFGSGHELHGESLGKAFVRIRGTHTSARTRMIGYFGIRWSHQYASEEDAGVQMYGLIELQLPPSPWPQEPSDV